MGGWWGVSQSLHGCFGEEKLLLPLPGIEIQIVQTTAYSLY